MFAFALVATSSFKNYSKSLNKFHPIFGLKPAMSGDISNGDEI